MKGETMITKRLLLNYIYDIWDELASLETRIESLEKSLDKKSKTSRGKK